MPRELKSLNFIPGIKRDGTALEGAMWSGGEWVRFYRGLPKKMGGYYMVTSEFSDVIREVYVRPRQDLNRVFCFTKNGIECVNLDKLGYGNGRYDRTPAGFAVSDDNTWTVDALYDAGGSATNIVIAHASQALTNIDDATNLPIYYGDVNAATAFTALGKSVSGGIAVVHPYLFFYGNDGYIGWSAVNSPTELTSGDAGEANISSTKVCRILPTRGTGQSPSALVWSLDAFGRLSWVGGGAVFRHDPISSQTSLLSQRCVVEYDNQFFWIGVDRFNVYSGSLQELPNTVNSEWFFDNLNWTHRNKVWGTKIPRWGEIWWHFPKGDSTECNHAIIFNVREKTWYDVAINRSAGAFAQMLPVPLWADSVIDPVSNKFSLWGHERGRDIIIRDDVLALRSSIETPNFGLPTGGLGSDESQGVDAWTRIDRIEPDFKQVGNMTVEVLGRDYANAADRTSNPYVFSEGDGKVDIREQQRHIRLRFTSNATGGNYHLGKSLIHIEKGDERQ